MTQLFPNRICAPDTRRAGGPDGQGWNRLAIHVFTPEDRCSQRPRTWQAAVDTYRGMAQLGVFTSYEPCEGSEDGCASCHITRTQKDPWVSTWVIREDGNGLVWVLGSQEMGFSAKGYAFNSWEMLTRAIDVPKLVRLQDNTGLYWRAAA